MSTIDCIQAPYNKLLIFFFKKKTLQEIVLYIF